MKSFVYCFFVCLTLVSGVQASAQTNRSFRKGYRGDVELGNYATFGKDEAGGMILFTSTHGYSMGNGMFIGGGAGRFGVDAAQRPAEKISCAASRACLPEIAPENAKHADGAASTRLK